MELSAKARYAVMAMVDLARAQAPGQTQGHIVRIADIALRQNLPQAFLEQLFAKLRRAGLVASVRGPHGGYHLARPADLITIGSIWAAVDENVQATACTNSDGCMGRSARCATHDLWAELEVHIDQFARSISLADVANGDVRGKAAAFAAGPQSADCVTLSRLKAARHAHAGSSNVGAPA